MANKVYQIVTERIIEKLETAIKEGTAAPWHKPWSGADGFPINHVSQRPYSGINLLLLDEGEEYLTWSQLCDLQKHQPELHVRQGSKANLVVYFSFTDGTKEVITDGKIEERQIKIPFLKYYRVFSVSDIEGLTHRRERQTVRFEHDPIEQAERVCADYVQREGIKLNIRNSNRAYYSPALDEVVVPELCQFRNKAEYYSALFHELTHSTGASSRLDRFKGASKFGSGVYSKEELIAEIGASLLCAHCGIDNSEAADNSVAYLRSWLKALRDDVTLIVSAAAKAQKAADFILGFKQEEIV